MKQTNTKTKTKTNFEIITKLQLLTSGVEIYDFFRRNRCSKKKLSSVLGIVDRSTYNVHPDQRVIPILHKPKHCEISAMPLMSDIGGIVELLLPVMEGDEFDRDWLNGVWINEDSTAVASNGYAMLLIRGLKYKPDTTEFWRTPSGASDIPDSIKTEVPYPFENTVPVGKPISSIYYKSRLLLEYVSECLSLTKGIPQFAINFAETFIDAEILLRILKVTAVLSDEIKCDIYGEFKPLVITNPNLGKGQKFVAAVMPMRIAEGSPYFNTPPATDA